MKKISHRTRMRISRVLSVFALLLDLYTIILILSMRDADV